MWIKATLVQILAPPFPSHVATDNLFNLSQSQFHHLHIDG